MGYSDGVGCHILEKARELGRGKRREAESAFEKMLVCDCGDWGLIPLTWPGSPMDTFTTYMHYVPKRHTLKTYLQVNADERFWPISTYNIIDQSYDQYYRW